jgi:D-alanine-D-alanine ligase
MDKAHMKSMFVAHGLPVGPFEVISDAQWQRDASTCIDRVASLGFPVFVKPSRAGSSIGITKVKSRGELRAAIEDARQHDPKVIVEAAVTGMREIECGVLVDDAGIARASLPAEIIVTGDHEFYDFEAKYLEDSAVLQVPADIDAETTKRVQQAAIDAFESLDCEGFARCDFFVLSDGDVIINEVNTLPGFTSISMFPRMWQATGLSYPEIVATLIRDALRRGCGLR